MNWVAMSFVQRPEDVAEGKKLIGGKAALLAKIKSLPPLVALRKSSKLPTALWSRAAIWASNCRPEQVPPLQKKIVSTARQMGEPVVVATQMLEIDDRFANANPRRSFDIATAIYDGADAVMLWLKLLRAPGR